MRALAIVVTLTAAGPALAGTYEATPADDLEAKVAALVAGDELIVHGGTYTLTGRFSVDLVGTAAAPIVIRAATGERPVIDRPATDQNIWDLDRVEHVTLRGLEWTGGSAGVRISAADHLTIEDCEIHHTADVALRANDGGATYRNLLIRHNHIHDTGGTGEGMYLGCNNDGCRVLDSVIERNWVHATNGPTVSQGDGIELKEGSAGNVIRDNVVHDTGYPCILTYSTVGNGAANVIERNLLWGCGDHAIQSAADAVIRNNIILGSVANGIAMQPHQAGTPGNLTVVHNTVLHATNDAIRVSGMTGAVTIANNALYAQAGNAIAASGDTSQLVVAGNRGAGATAGISAGFTASSLAADLTSASYTGAPPNDVFPAAGGGLIGAGDPAHAVADDFNGAARVGAPDVGAYAFAAGGNPGWQLMAGFKDLAAGSGGADGGVDGGVGGDGERGGCCQTSSAPLPSTALLAGLLALALGRRRRRA
ncbi:MAG: right-handed parallel beta-helix repeat-containing protein [Myxococcales bacterium]|nr:right-handed parallel beta-helix repeat-containing protein [Myxococcales bacterium]